MKQFVIIGIGAFGCRVLNELKDMGSEIIIIDNDPDVIDKFKDRVNGAFIADASEEDVLKKIIPSNVDGVILDLPSNLDSSILAISYLKKLGVSNIIVKSDSDKHGEILKTVGATTIIYPDLEAAKQITPILVSDTLFNFTPISSGLVMAEIIVPKQYIGKTLIESNLRYKEGINIVAIKKDFSSEYSFFVPDYVLKEEDILLSVGEESNIRRFSSAINCKNDKIFSTFFQRMFGK
jgi:trk system potassium uptake protein